MTLICLMCICIGIVIGVVGMSTVVWMVASLVWHLLELGEQEPHP